MGGAWPVPLPGPATIATFPSKSKTIHRSHLEASITLKHFHWIVAARKVMASLVFQPFDPLAFFEDLKRYVLWYHNHYILFAADKVSVVDQDRFFQLSRNANWDLKF